MGVYSRIVESRASRTDDAQHPRVEPAPEPSSIGEVVAGVGARVQEIIDTAERLAAEIRAEATASSAKLEEQRRREVDRIVEQRLREMGSLTEALAARAESLHREATALVEEMDHARRRMTALRDADPEVDRPVERQPLQPVAYPGKGSAPARPEQAVLRATQMAVAGSERSEIERMLREEFGMADPTAAVDDMLRSQSA